MFSGTGVAIVTPFKDRAVDYQGLARVIEHCLAGGVNYIVSLGTTGETVTLSPEERREVLRFTALQVRERVPIVAGFGGNNTDQIVHSIETQDFAGIDALLSVSPYYNRPTQEGIFRHYMALAEASPLPIILYNVPSRTASNMSSETTLRLAHASQKFIGVKEASGNLMQCSRIYQDRPEGFLVISGDDNLTLPMLALGMDGVISVAANAFPAEMVALTHLCLNEDFKAARRLHHRLLNLMELLFVEGNPAGVKGALEILGKIGREVRLPLMQLTEESMRKMEEEMEEMNRRNEIPGNVSLHD